MRVGAISHQFYVRAAVGRKDRWRDQANSHPIRPGQNYQRNPLVSSTTRVQGQRGCRPFPLHPQSPPDLLRFASDHLTRTILLDEAEHFLHNHHASVASLRLLFTFRPERRSACLRNRCSPSPEYPFKVRSLLQRQPVACNCIDIRVLGQLDQWRLQIPVQSGQL